MVFKSESCGVELLKRGFWAHYTFETARDMLLKIKPQVIQIFTNAGLLELSKLFSGLEYRNNNTGYASIFLKNDNVEFYISDYPIDSVVNIPGYTKIEREAIKRASKHAIFTIDGFFYSIKDDIFLDPLDAYKNLRDGIIKTVASPNDAISSFPDLAIKTVKIYSKTGFVIDNELKSLLKSTDSGKDYKKITPEIAGDFIDICGSNRAYDALLFLDEWGVLDEILPELTELKYVNQDKDHHPEGNAFWHTLNCLKCIKKPDKNLMMATLLHDTGKAKTQTIKRNHKAFPDHSIASKLITKDVLKRFYFRKEDIDEVLFLVENHMMLCSYKKLPENILKRLFSSPYFQNLLELYRADLKSGYHNLKECYEVAMFYRDFVKRERLKSEGYYQ